ncbi:caspase family protein [Pseudogemmobacter faecipullorum]|uniref:Caspase family protein n=1 Tax=Pseudogemmobacter faecipullorum TaxID=2755041 RepID=A0ABS8CJQ7_9RHOB|nr:caspase family protein [Pseudogemmobacter faecipullorum]MCB5409632.1 caspase family protein [Pseudogemmobacter faecipullorum]
MRVSDRPILRPLRRLLLGLGLSLLALPGLARENFALLIGASDYQNLDKRWSLKGPRNDMDLVSVWLTGQSPVPFSPENVTVLTDGREGDIPATLGNIRQAFADLTARLAPGDFVYLHLSGHGTRAPALDPASEPDGLDELFLPVDIGPWSNQTGAVENALVDDEIALLLDGLRNRGADVWIVFDACHSGTATRALETGDEVVMRQLDPEALGITGEMLAEAEAGAEAVSRSLAAEPAEALLPDAGPSFLPRTAARPEPGVTPGSLVAFYAAQSTELTPEMRLPRGAPDRKSQGVFTYTLFEVLSEYPSASYGQVAQEVLRKYATRNAAKSTPLFEGDLDRVVFGGAPGGRIAQWPGRQSDGGFTLAAGALQGLGPGAELAVLARAADAPDQALGFVRVTEAEVFTARAEAIEKDGLTLPEDLPEGFYLRRVDVALDFALSIALPPPGTAAADALYAALPEVKAAAGSRLSFVEPGELADLALAVLPESGAPEAIWILPGTGFADPVGPQPKVEAVALSAAGLADELATKLGAMAKAINLMKLGAALGPVALDVDVTLRTRNAGAPELRGLELTPVPTLVTADEVHVLARNHMQIPVDVNVLYIGADYSIGHFYSGRLHPGEELKKGLFAIGGETMGAERMLVVMNPASPHSQVEDLSYLAQEAVRSLGTAGLTSLNAALFEAGFGGETRGAIALSSEEDTTGGGPGPGILQVELRTRAAD